MRLRDEISHRGRMPVIAPLRDGTYRFLDKKNEATFVKFHWRPKLGMQSVVWDEALKISGADPDFHRRYLWHAIDNGNFPEWELGLQLFDEKLANDFDFDVLDATKIIPEEVLPLRIVGRLVLDRNVDNFFAETEQVAFSSGMWCQVLISPTTRFCRGIFLPIRTPSLSDSVGPISSRSRCQIRNRRFRPFPALKGEVPSLLPSSPASATHPAGTVPCLENPIYDRTVRRLAGRVRLIL